MRNILPLIPAILIVSVAASCHREKPVQATVIFMKGDLKDGQGRKINLGDRLQGGDVLVSGDTTIADLQVSTGKIRMLSNTTLQISSIRSAESVLKATRGDILAKVSRLSPGQSYRVETPTVVAAVRGTQFWGRVNPDESGTFAVREGSVEITRKSDGAQLLIKAGQAADLKAGAALSPRQAVKGEMDAMSQIDQM